MNNAKRYDNTCPMAAPNTRPSEDLRPTLDLEPVQRSLDRKTQNAARLAALATFIHCGYQGYSHNQPPIPFRAPGRWDRRLVLN